MSSTARPRTPHPDRVTYEPRARRLRVARAETLSPSMRRIVLTGDDLEPQFPFRRMAAADHVKLVLPDPTSGELTLPAPGRPPEPGSPPPIKRDYTVRRVDHAARELSIDFVLHQHGPAGRWARDAQAGGEVGVLGPRSSRVFPTATHRHYLLVADETGLPAVGRFLEELPAHIAISAVLFTAEEAAIPVRSGAVVQRVAVPSPDEAEAVVADALAPTGAGLETFAWCAGEAGLMRHVRSHLRGLLPGDDVVVKGYWRPGVAGPLPRDTT